MRIDLRGRQVHVPQQHLIIHELGARLQKPCSVGVAELMGRHLHPQRAKQGPSLAPEQPNDGGGQ
jgi:hypothetical protein